MRPWPPSTLTPFCSPASSFMLQSMIDCSARTIRCQRACTQHNVQDLDTVLLWLGIGWL